MESKIGGNWWNWDNRIFESTVANIVSTVSPDTKANIFIYTEVGIDIANVLFLL